MTSQKEAYVAPVGVGSKAIKVLVLDGNVDRSNSFTLRGSGYHLRVLRTEAAVVQHFQSPEQWDLAFHSLFLGDWNVNPEKYAAPLVEAFKLGRIKGVICTSTIHTEAKKFVELLKAAGVPCRYIPYNYTDPSVHNRVDL